MKEFPWAWRVSTGGSSLSTISSSLLGVSPCWGSLSVSGFRKTQEPENSFLKGLRRLSSSSSVQNWTVKGKKGPCRMAWMDPGAGQVTTNTMLPG